MLDEFMPLVEDAHARGWDLGFARAAEWFQEEPEDSPEPKNPYLAGADHV
jgi:hypothetical protein